jgi:hypothetical protein
MYYYVAAHSQVCLYSYFVHTQALGLVGFLGKWPPLFTNDVTG